MKKYFISISLTFLFLNSFSQTISGSLDSYLNDKIIALPLSGLNNYTNPTSFQLVKWETTILYILEKNIEDARQKADEFNYRIVEFTDTLSDFIYYVLEEKAIQENYWGTYIFNLNACRQNLVLQAPHLKFDFNTGFEAVFCFSRLSAKSLF